MRWWREEERRGEDNEEGMGRGREGMDGEGNWRLEERGGRSGARGGRRVGPRERRGEGRGREGGDVG